MNPELTLIERVRLRMASGEVELPVFDGAAIEIHREARENRLDAQGICGLLERDSALVSEVLRMANSSFFCGLNEVRTLRDACVRLGVRQIAAIVFSVSQKRLYSSSAGPYRARFETLWQHASMVSIGARWLANESGHARLGDEAFIAGLLHDIGMLCTLRLVEQIARDDVVAGRPTIEAEQIDEALEWLNREQGIRLLQHWKMPSAYIDVVTRLFDEPRPDDPPVLSMVRLADSAGALMASGESSPSEPEPADVASASLLGLDVDIVERLRCALAGADEPLESAGRAA